MTFDQFLEDEIWRNTISIHSISTKDDFNKALRHACFFKHPNQRLKSHAHHAGGQLEVVAPEEFQDSNYEDTLSKVSEVISERWWEVKKNTVSKSNKTSRKKSSTA